MNDVDQYGEDFTDASQFFIFWKPPILQTHGGAGYFDMRAHMVKTISQSTVRPDVNLVWCICVFVFVNLTWCVYLYLISLQTCFANNQNRCEPSLDPQPTYSWKSASDAGT